MDAFHETLTIAFLATIFPLSTETFLLVMFLSSNRFEKKNSFVIDIILNGLTFLAVKISWFQS